MELVRQLTLKVKAVDPGVQVASLRSLTFPALELRTAAAAHVPTAPR